MLMILLPLLILLATSWILPIKRLWGTTIPVTMTPAFFSLLWLMKDSNPFMNQYFYIDEISSPLLILTCWLTPPTLLASMNKLSKEPPLRQRTFIFTIIFLQTSTLLAFMANNMMLFFIMFETTMIPTLILITRWGAQKERMMAGIYFLFYTMFGSLALLATLLFFHETFGTSSIPLMKEASMKISSSYTPLWLTTCLLAFLVKMPLYGVHLWLPKAHVEAPIAGSMILAGTLLKLGGYGILRTNLMLDNLTTLTVAPLITFTMIGILLSASLCSRQTDLKSLIAFSSVSHMGLVIAASFMKTKWSIHGALILMVSHGLVSSTLFCLANTLYERTNTRTLTLLSGTQIILPLAAAWWLLTALLNMSLPPSPNFVAELSIITSMFQWSNLTILIAALAIIFTTSYSLYLFWMSQRGNLNPHMKSISPLTTRENILIALHIIPALLMTFNLTLLF